jgi:hypothetical protein
MFGLCVKYHLSCANCTRTFIYVTVRERTRGEYQSSCVIVVSPLTAVTESDPQR